MSGASLSWLHARAISRVGCKTSIGLGSCTIKKPQMLLMISVFPHWLAIMQTTRCTRGSLNASIIPRWYSARLVCHLPGNGELSRLRIRSASAHCETVNLGGGLNISNSSVLKGLAGEFCKNFSDASFNDFFTDCGIIFNCNNSTDCSGHG